MDKKQLYESIMKQVAIEVKKALNEAYYFDKPDQPTFSEQDYIEYAREIKADFDSGNLSGHIETDDDFPIFIDWHIDDYGDVVIVSASMPWADRDGGEDDMELDNIDEDMLNAAYRSLN